MKYVAVDTCNWCPHWSKDLQGCCEMDLRWTGTLNIPPDWCPLPDTTCWQPIETAPKDGSRILLLLPKNTLADGFWWAAYGDWSFHPGWYEGFTVEDRPTHWMPLPDAPRANRAK